MKQLKIESNQGYYLDGSGAYQTIEKINKVELLRLVDVALTQEFEFDEFDSALLKNHAHQIIYKSLVEKLKGLISRKQEFLDESARLYLAQYEKYRET